MAHPLDDPRIDRALLTRFDFDEAGIRADFDRIRAGTLTAADAVQEGQILPAPEVGEVKPATADPALIEAGEAALAAGRVAQVVLNGGMATRFGGVVKGVVEVFDKKSFIALKAEDVKRASERYGAPLPLVLMNSFATHDKTMVEAKAHSDFGLPEGDLLSFTQSISVRLTPEGELYVGADDKPSYHAPGHGDFFRCIRRSGVLQQLLDRGVEYILFSNVDNLGATVEPAVLGHHIQSKKAMTAELTEKRRTASGGWDKGGAAVTVDGMLRVVEGFRFPPGFQQDQLPDFSTNNFIFTAEALTQEIPLDRYVVTKKVAGAPVLQLESIACEASGVVRADGSPALPLNPLRVPRDGKRGRFFPVKEPSDLDQLRDTLRARLAD